MSTINEKINEKNEIVGKLRESLNQNVGFWRADTHSWSELLSYPTNIRAVFRDDKVANMIVSTPDEFRGKVSWLVKEQAKHIWQSFNCLKPNPPKSISNSDVESYRFLFLDFDTEKDPTDEERIEALSHAIDCRDELMGEWGFPAPIVGFSGNGSCLYFAVENLGHREISLLYAGITSLGYRIDQSCKDAAQVSRVFGTVNRKGNHQNWRSARLLDSPSTLSPITSDLANKFADFIDVEIPEEVKPRERIEDCPEKQESTLNYYMSRLDSKGFSYDVLEKGTSVEIKLEECPFCKNVNGDGHAAIIIEADGCPGFNCFHANSCHDSNGEKPNIISLNALLSPPTLRELPDDVAIESMPSPPLKAVKEVGDPCFDADTKKEEPKKSDYKFSPISAAQLADMQFSIEWLVNGVLVGGQPCIVGAPKKTLKTCLMTDLAISLGSGLPFLGKFKVPKKVRTVFISGESGEFTIKETCLRISNSKGIPLNHCDCHFDFRLPKLSVEEEVRELSEGLKKMGAKVAIIDPLYLCLLSGGDKRAENLYDMGPLLQQISNACLSVGCTPILIHHAKKNMATPYQPLELEDLSYSGVQEFARQWILLSRREKYNPAIGEHKLFMTYGGSVGHSGLRGVNVKEGIIKEDFSGRTWEVEVITLDEIKEVREAEKVAKKDQVANELGEELIGFLPSTKNKLKTELGWGPEKVARTLQRLINDGKVQAIDEVINRKNGSKMVVETYHLVNPSGEPVRPDGLKSDGFIE